MSSALENRAQIAGMIAEEGVAVSIVQIVPGAYDVATGNTAAGVATTYTGRGRFGTYSDYQIASGSALRGDRKLTFQPTDWSYVPAITDIVTVPAGYSVIGPIQMRELGGTPFSYTIQLRGKPAG